MNLDSTKFHALTVQFIQTEEALILKRGCTEIRIPDNGAARIARSVLAMCSTGAASRGQILAQFPDEHRAAIEPFISQLIDCGFLVPSDSILLPKNGHEGPLDIFYWNFGKSTSEVTDNIGSRRIAILGVNFVSRQLARALYDAEIKNVCNLCVVDYPVLRNLCLFGETAQLDKVQWSDGLQEPLRYEEWKESLDVTRDCIVATSDFGMHPSLLDWNRFCVERNCHFFPIVLHNVIGHVGPLVVPGQTPCYECYTSRRYAHLEDPDAQKAIEEASFEGQVIVGFHPSMASILGEVAAFELIKFYSGVLPRAAVGTLIEINLLATKLTTRKILKIPRCNACSPLENRASTNPKKATGSVRAK